jgi:DNA-binding NtrC family response regulator
MPDVFDFLQKKVPAKQAHYLLQNCLQLTQSLQAKEVQATNTVQSGIQVEMQAIVDCTLIYAKSNDRLTVEGKTNLPKEHLRNSLQHDSTRAVLAFAVLIDSSAYSGPPALWQFFASR